MELASKPRNRGIMQRKFDDSTRNGGAVHVPQELRVPPAIPSWYFFYGTLADPKRLAQVAELDKEPTMAKAKVMRSCLKRFGHYPVLCIGSQIVHGVVWFAPTSEIVERLREYESDAYREYPKFVKMENGDEILAMTFIWNGEEEDLEDGDKD
ncbi:MAG: hypothetical protein M1820_006276 [Bogoriella megaspora]|nr:MAG: hypothetical protein M1820_006276 [Bogoriella megaspora]